MSQQSTLREYLLSYCQQTHHDGHAMSHNLSGCDLSGCDLRGLDLSGVDFTDANLTGAHLEGTRLHAATLTRATLANIPVGVLMDAGLSPRILLHHRSEADRHKFSALHFSPVASSLAPLLLSAKECTKICQTLRERCWEDLTDEAAFTVLYPAEPYDPWMARCRSRLILSWALVHRAALGRTETIPFYGRVLPSTLMDEVEETDLVAGIKTSPERVFHTLGIRQILAQSDLQGRDVAYPLSPFGDAEGVVQIKTRRALQLEGGLMHHCVASYDSSCLSGRCFIYHIGPAAPEGSTLELLPDGSVGQHRAVRNRAPSREDREHLSSWLTSLGISSERGNVMERICERLRREGIVKVSFQIYWYGDQDVVDDVYAEDKDGKGVIMRTVSDDDLWDLADEEYGNQYGKWELFVEEQRLDWVGEESPPEDEEDEWEDEEDEWDEAEEEEDA